MLSVCEWGLDTTKCSAHGAWACFIQGGVGGGFGGFKKNHCSPATKKKKRIMRFCSVYPLLHLLLGETSVIQQEEGDGAAANCIC